jgi:Spy/CpxP family protein refolding chaperone
MTRLFRVSLAVAGLAIVVLAAQVAEAQPGQGGGQGRGRGRGGFGRGGNVVTVASNAQVQTLIAATDDQKTKIGEVSSKLQEDQGALFQNAGEGGIDVNELNKLVADAEAKVAAILDATQNTKVLSIMANVNGGQSLTNSQMQKHLKVTDDQKSKLNEVAAANRGGGGRRGMSDEERAALDKQYTDVLTTEQQAEFANLKAVQAVDDELAQQLRRGGRGGGRGRRGGGN